jgi:hypothetical protein
MSYVGISGSVYAQGASHQRLANDRSDDARRAMTWLRRPIVASLLLLPIWTLYVSWNAVSPLGYVNPSGFRAGARTSKGRGLAIRRLVSASSRVMNQIVSAPLSASFSTESYPWLTVQA